MRTWREMYDSRDWDALENWQMHYADRTALIELRDCLLRDVPKIVKKNGMEEVVELVSTKEAPEEWKGGARILEMGELQARIDVHPPSAQDIWREEQRRVEAQLSALRAQPEPTVGDTSLSRREHVDIALALLEQIDSETNAYLSGELAEGTDPKEVDGLAEIIAQMVYPAYLAGFHARAAIGKDGESHAVRGLVVQRGASHGGRLRQGAQKPDIERRLAFMADRIAKGDLVKTAASLASERVGGTVAGNQKLWQRRGSSTTPP